MIISEMFHGRISLNSVLLLLLVNFVSGFRFKPHSPPWFSAACAAVIVHRNHFLCLYQQNKSSESKVKFRQANNRKWQIADSFLSKGKSAIPTLFNNPEVFSSASDKAKLFAKNFSKNCLKESFFPDFGRYHS